jgi:hypothetical protein
MSTQSLVQDRGLWVRWALAFLGFPLGGLAAQALAGSITAVGDAALGGMASGAVIGAAQWLVLRHRLTLPAWWIAATSVGLGLGLALGFALYGGGTGDPDLVLRALVAGAALGGAQYPLLRARVPGAAIWPAIVALGWALGWLVTRAAGVDLTPNWSVFGATGALTFQLVTGLALAWLLRRGTPAA